VKRNAADYTGELLDVGSVVECIDAAVRLKQKLYRWLKDNRPEVMARWGRLLAEIRRPVDDRRFELVTLAVAHELRHTPGSLAHGNNLAEIIGTDQVVAIANGEKATALTEAELAIVEFARKIAKDASAITADEVDTLKEDHGLSDEDVFDVAAIASAPLAPAQMLS